MNPIERNLKSFLGSAYPDTPSNAIRQRYAHRTTTQANVLQYLPIISKLCPHV